MKFYSFCLKLSGLFGFIAYKTVRKSENDPASVRQNHRTFCKGNILVLFKKLHFSHTPCFGESPYRFFPGKGAGAPFADRPEVDGGRAVANPKTEILSRTGVFLFLIISGVSFYSFGEEKVLDLGEIEITGEVRRPNINLIYSKKYIKRAVNIIAREEFKSLESDLLKPTVRSNKRAVTRKKSGMKPAGKTNQKTSEGKTRHLKPRKRVKKISSGKEETAKGRRSGK